MIYLHLFHQIFLKNNFYEIYGCGLKNYRNKKNITIDAGNSGTLARLICGLLSNYNHKVKIIGDESLSKRDFKRIAEPLKKFGANFSLKDNKKLPMTISGLKYPKPITVSASSGEKLKPNSSAIFLPIR